MHEKLSKEKIRDLEKQGYRLVGNHSAIKVCLWTKKGIRNEDVCYKNKFYGINSHRCVQMSPCFICNHRCIHCWRDIDFTPKKWSGKIDSPKEIVDKCIKAHVEYLYGFGGNEKADKKKYDEVGKPKHFAISLTGEPTFYPKLPKLIDEIKKRDMTAFLVTNGTNPVMIKKLIKYQPTQLYITLPAPDKKTYIKTCNPLIKDGWEKILKSLALLKTFKRSVIRLTLVKHENMIRPEEYAAIIKKFQPTFVELKAYMWVGFSRERLTIENMPLHSEIKEFAEQIAKDSGYKVIDEKNESRVVLLARREFKARILHFNPK